MDKVHDRKESLVTKYNIYVPNRDENFRTIATIGERYFFQNVFWKLFVMLGYDWTDISITRSGFSNLKFSKSNESLKKKLDNLGIEYRTSSSAYTLRINISRKRKQLERIAEMYKLYEMETFVKAKSLGLYMKDNYWRSDEMISIREWVTGKRITKLINIQELYGR